MFRLILLNYRMVKKCCVYGCTSNYASEKKKTGVHVSVYRFPKDETERSRWIKSIPNANLRVTANTVVCELHWPPGFEALVVCGKVRPKDPPSVWPNVPVGQIPTSSPALRSTQRSSSAVRSQAKDEMALFSEMEEVDFQSLNDSLLNQKRTFQSKSFKSFSNPNLLHLNLPAAKSLS